MISVLQGVFMQTNLLILSFQETGQAFRNIPKLTSLPPLHTYSPRDLLRCPLHVFDALRVVRIKQADHLVGNHRVPVQVGVTCRRIEGVCLPFLVQVVGGGLGEQPVDRLAFGDHVQWGEGFRCPAWWTFLVLSLNVIVTSFI